MLYYNIETLKTELAKDFDKVEINTSRFIKGYMNVKVYSKHFKNDNDARVMAYKYFERHYPNLLSNNKIILLAEVYNEKVETRLNP